MKRFGWLFAACALCVVPGAGRQLAAQSSGLPFVLPEAFETRSALAAAPENLRADAGVWLLGAKGYYQSKPSKNGFDCIVERDPSKEGSAANRQMFAPQCFDAPSSKTRMAFIVERSKLIRDKGHSSEEADGKLNGDPKFRPKEAGIVYMASALNTLTNPDEPQGAFAAYPPHVMFLAPGRDDQSVSGGMMTMEGGMLSGWPFLPGPASDAGLIIVPLDRALQDKIVSAQGDLVKELSRYITFQRLYLL